MDVLIYVMTPVGWKCHHVEFQTGTPIKYYLKKVNGLMGKVKRNTILLGRNTPKGPIWSRARMTTVLKEGEHVGLTPWKG